MRAFDKGCRNFLLCWPRQIGKDTMCFAILAREACKKAGNYFYIFPEATQAREALWQKIMSDECEGIPITDMIPAPFLDPKKGGSVNNQSMSMKLTNGSTITVLGLDAKPDKVRGITPTGVIFSEFAFSENMFEGYKIAAPSFRRKGMWQIINSTPNGRNHFYKMFHGTKDDKNWFVSLKQGLWPEKPNYIHIRTKEEFEAMVATGQHTWDDIEREYGCSFQAGLKGSFYSDSIEVAKEEQRIGFFPYNSAYPVYTGWDLGVDDQTVVWFYQVIDAAKVFIDCKEWDTALGASGYIQYLADKPYRYETHNLPHDAANRRVGLDRVASTLDLMEESARNIPNMTGDFQIVPKPTNKQHAIDLVRSQFTTYFFNVSNENVARGLERVELFHRKYDRKRRAFTKEPVHDVNSHSADALQSCALATDLTNNSFYMLNNMDDQGLDNFDVFDI
jgi:hypothetical protein